MPDDVIEEYGFREKATTNGYVYVSVSKRMYGLPQAGIIAQQLLEKRIWKEGYVQSQFTPGLWSHEWRPIQFSLVVDNFGVEYIGKEHFEHLVGVIKMHYEMTTDWECSFTLEWDYIKQEFNCPCQNISVTLSTVSTTWGQKSFRTSRISMSPTTMEQKSNTQNPKTNPSPQQHQ